MEHESADTLVGYPEQVWDIAYITFASRTEQVTKIRRQMREFLTGHSFPSSEIADIEIAVGEACTNAMKHGSPRGEADEIRLRCMVNAQNLVVEISDCGYGFDPNSVSLPIAEKLSEGGMGVFLMRALMDSVEFEFERGTTVRLTKRR